MAAWMARVNGINFKCYLTFTTTNDLFVTIMLVINCFKVFDLVQVMTGGGPGRATNVLV